MKMKMKNKIIEAFFGAGEELSFKTVDAYSQERGYLFKPSAKVVVKDGQFVLSWEDMYGGNNEELFLINDVKTVNYSADSNEVTFIFQNIDRNRYGNERFLRFVLDK